MGAFVDAGSDEVGDVQKHLVKDDDQPTKMGRWDLAPHNEAAVRCKPNAQTHDSPSEHHDRVVWDDLDEYSDNGADGTKIKEDLATVTRSNPSSSNGSTTDASNFDTIHQGLRSRCHGIPAECRFKVPVVFEKTGFLDSHVSKRPISTVWYRIGTHGCMARKPPVRPWSKPNVMAAMPTMKE